MAGAVGRSLAPVAPDQWLDLANARRACDVDRLVAGWDAQNLTLVNVRARIERLALRPDDPRIGRALTRFIRAFPLTYSADNAAWQALTKLVVRTGDIRGLAELEEGATQALLRADVARLRTTLGALRFAAVDPARLARLRAAAAQLPPMSEAAVLEASQTRVDVDEAELVRRICASPTNDEPRLVYGDFLTERGDLRGELIALQFKESPTPKDHKRIRALIREHGSAWLGPIEPAVEKPGRVFARGFLSEARVHFKSDEQRRTLLTHPLWNTLEVLHAGRGSVDAFLLACPLLGLRRIAGWGTRAALAAQMAARAAPYPQLEQLSLSLDGAEPAALATLGTAQALPRLNSLDLLGWEEIEAPEAQRWLLDSALARQLKRLRLTAFVWNVRDWLTALGALESFEVGVHERLAFFRAPGGWTVRVSCAHAYAPYAAKVLPPLRDQVQRVVLDRGSAGPGEEARVNARFDEIKKALKDFEVTEV